MLSANSGFYLARFFLLYFTFLPVLVVPRIALVAGGLLFPGWIIGSLKWEGRDGNRCGAFLQSVAALHVIGRSEPGLSMHFATGIISE